MYFQVLQALQCLPQPQRKSSHTRDDTLMNLWLSSNKTLFTKIAGGLDFAYGLQFATPVVDEWGKDRLICEPRWEKMKWDPVVGRMVPPNCPRPNPQNLC